jgi:hypothetical protein
MKKILVYFVIIFPLIFFSSYASAAKWKGYVIKVFDYGLLKGKEREKKMIFPRSETYSSKEECYEEFGNLFQYDPYLSKKYPQTNDPFTSYLYGCVKKKFLGIF